MKIAHFVNVIDPLRLPLKSDLHIAQSITLDSMVKAQKFSSHSVELYAVKHISESVIIPPEFSFASDINRYCYDVFKILPKNKSLPFIGDVFNSMRDYTHVDYLVYTNIDIGIIPSFYNDIVTYLQSGIESLMINRRTMPRLINDQLVSLNNYHQIFNTQGTYHPGCDCFVFPQNILNKIYLGNVFLGFPPVAEAIEFCLYQNISKSNRLWLNRHTYHKTLTFHFGDAKSWLRQRATFNDLYHSFNRLAYIDLK